MRALAAVLAAALAGQPPPAPLPLASREPAASDYKVGVGDVLELEVFGNQDLSRTPTVQSDGTITLPLLGEVSVAGLSIAEIKQKLTNLLAKDYLVNPQVEVRVKEYQSQFVTVIGEVNTPGRKPLRGRTRLIDVLVESGGFTPRASGEIVITRLEGGFEGGEKTLRLRFGTGPATLQDQVNLEIPLKNGDIVSASQKQTVAVEGEVTRPGRYTIEGELTVSAAISLAGGLTRFGGSKVRLRRVDSQTGKVEILTVDLKAIRKGKNPDPPVMANDVISVPRRLF
jgi:polysaccharide export outer membrane protein